MEVIVTIVNKVGLFQLFTGRIQPTYIGVKWTSIDPSSASRTSQSCCPPCSHTSRPNLCPVEGPIDPMIKMQPTGMDRKT